MWKLWSILLVCLMVVVGSIGFIAETDDQQAEYTRGWELATRQEPMPYRQPLGGVNVELTQYDGAEIKAQLDAIASLGFHWVRQPIYWEMVEPEPGELDWSRYDPIVQAVHDHPDLELVAVLDGTPQWARHREAPNHPFAPPASTGQYGDFAGAAAAQYAEEIDYYQIWDEPNIRSHWGNLDPRPSDYVAMLRSAYDAIHDADDEATVIAAALAPNTEDGPENLSDILYLKAIYNQGGGGYFDAAAGKPYGYDHPPDDRRVDWEVLNFSRLILLREEMVAQGDGDKLLWGSNFGWNHLPEDWIGPPSIWGQVSAEEQIRYTREAYQRAEDEWPWVGGLILQHWQPEAPDDDPMQGFAIAPHIGEWLEDGPRFTEHTLIPGLYPADHPLIQYEGNWEFNALGAYSRILDEGRTENIIIVPFEGTEFAIRLQRDDYTAYLTINIDGGNANALPENQQDESFVIFTSASRQPSTDLIQVATDLPAGEHIATIRHEQELGEAYTPIVGFAVAHQPETESYAQRRLLARIAIIFAVVVGGFTLYRLPWRKVRLPSAQSLRNMGDTLLMLAVTAVFITGAALSWGDTFSNFLRRDPPALLLTLSTVTIAVYSPVVWFSLIALLAFAILVFNRPLLGLLAVMFWSAFFTSTVDTYFRLFNAVEIFLVISAAAILGRWLFETAKAIWQTQPDTENEKKDWHWWTGWLQLQLDKHLHLFDVSMVIFCGLAIVSLSWTDLLPEAQRELRAVVLGPTAFYFLIRGAFLNKSALLLLTDVAILSGMAIALVGLFNYVTGEVVEADGARRLVSAYGSPNSVALHLGRCLPFTLAYLLLPLSEWRRAFAGITGLIMLVALLLTQSVAALLIGLPAAFAVVILGWQGRRALLPLAGAAVAGLVALIPLSQVIGRLRDVTDFENSTALIRLNVWRSTVQMIADHPFTGLGLDQFLYAYRSQYILPAARQDPDLSHPHNIIMDYWVRLGLLGVLVGIWFQLAFWWKAFRIYPRLKQLDTLLFALLIGAMGSMANFLFHGLVDVSYFAINLSYFFAFTLALLQRLETLAQQPGTP